MNKILYSLILLALLYTGCGYDNAVNNQQSNNYNTSLEQNIASENKDVTLQPSNWIIIDTLPYTITQPGSYKLKRDLTSPGGLNGIEVINTDHVTINMNDYSINAEPSASVEPTGIVVTNSSFVIIYNGDINYFRRAFEFTGSADCSEKDIEFTPVNGELMSSPPVHYSAVKIYNSSRIQASWSVFNDCDNSLEVYGALSTDCKFLSNTCYGNINATGRTYGVKYTDTLSSPKYSIIRNNLFTNYDYGYNFITKDGHNTVNSNTFRYFIDKGFNNDNTNEFRYNTFKKLNQ